MKDPEPGGTGLGVFDGLAAQAWSAAQRLGQTQGLNCATSVRVSKTGADSVEHLLGHTQGWNWTTSTAQRLGHTQVVIGVAETGVWTPERLRTISSSIMGP